MGIGGNMGEPDEIVQLVERAFKRPLFIGLLPQTENLIAEDELRSRIGNRAFQSSAVLECRTSVSLGGLPCTNFERDTIRKELRELKQELERLENQS